MLNDYLKESKDNYLFQLVEDIFGTASPFNAYDVIDGPFYYTIETAVPGYRKDQLSIDITGNVLEISGENKREGSNYVHQELRYGKFNRKFKLPSNVGSEIKAKLEDGILKITLPKQERAKPKIKIE
jgi:HSP20 family protein